LSRGEGLVSAHLLDGAGGGRPLSWDEVRAWRPEQGALWLHLDLSRPEVRAWLESESGLDRLAAQALTATETRPRSVVEGERLLVVLRGMNLNPQADPADMVALRAAIEPRRAITVRRRRLLAAEDLRQALARGAGPRSTGDLVAMLAALLVERMEPTLHALDEEMDAFEEAITAESGEQVRARLGPLRRRAIALRRHLAPQRDALARMVVERTPLLDELARAQLREVADRVTRYVEDLDALRERAAVAQEELLNRMSAQMNRTMYLLSIVAAIFLPLGLLTGLLGINVAGVPGTETSNAFWIVCAVLAGLAAVQVWLFRRLHFF
jgi:zinc transporter